MLLQLDPNPPFDAHCTKRLIALETHLRRSSEGHISVRRYRALLQDIGINVPRSDRTLQEDLRRYATYCDDVKYGGYAKRLELQPLAGRDAVVWLLGRPWLESPLQPHISSACLRCLLLAQLSRAEVQMQYRRLRASQEPWVPELVIGVPVRFIPGTDSGYIQMQMQEGHLANFNLMRLEHVVRFTEKPTDHYTPLPVQRQFEMVVETQDVHLLERLCWQFHGLKKQGEGRAVMRVEESLWVMTLDMIEGHLRRTQRAATRRIPDEPLTLRFNKDVTLHCREVPA
jgi:hypothetical protein